MFKSSIDVRAYTAAKIRYYRREIGWTQKDLGIGVGVQHNTVSGWESCVSEPTQEQLFRMARIFGVSINDLFPPTVDSNPVNDAEKRLLANFRRLNAEGQEKASSYIRDLTEMQKYTSKKEAVTSA